MRLGFCDESRIILLFGVVVHSKGLEEELVIFDVEEGIEFYSDAVEVGRLFKAEFFVEHYAVFIIGGYASYEGFTMSRFALYDEF